jgi:hypothetical protein
MTNPEDVASWPKPRGITRREAIGIFDRKMKNILYTEMPRIKRLRHTHKWTLATKIQVLASLLKEAAAYELAIKLLKQEVSDDET